MGRRAKEEWVPWSRARNYKGNLTEVEKREFDAFRSKPKHPAASFDELPQEVQDYINELEFELYDRKQDALQYGTLFVSAIGLAVILDYFLNILTIDTNKIYLILGGIYLIAPWFIYREKWKKNTEEFLPSADDAPLRSDEGIRRAWEIWYNIDQKHKSEKP